MKNLEFAQLKWDIEKAAENVEKLQEEYEDETGGRFLLPLRLAPMGPRPTEENENLKDSQPAGEAALCACKKPLISEKSYCTVCGRDIYAVAHPPAPITCPKCGEPDPVLQCEKCGNTFNRED